MYTVSYDPDDLHAGIEISKAGRFICAVPIYGKTGHRNRDAKREYKRTRNAWKKATKYQAEAAKGLIRAELADVADLSAEQPTPPELPGPKVVTPIRPDGLAQPPKSAMFQDPEVLPDEEIERLAAAARARKLRAAGEY